MRFFIFISLFAIIFTVTYASSQAAVVTSVNSMYELYGAWPSDNNTSANLDVATSDNIINAGNVGQLKPIFNNAVFAPGNAVQATPVIADGNVYYATSGGKVYSYTENGRLNWSKQTYAANGQPEFYDNTPVLTRRYLFIAGQQMHKLDRATGAEVVPPQVYDPVLSQFVPADHIEPSLIMTAGNLVIYSVAYTDEVSGNGALFAYTPGEIVAFRQNDLSVAWRINLTIDPKTGMQYGPGGGSFGQGAVDEVRHLFFIGTGNQYAAPASPISDSLLAINYLTGKIVWSYQFVSGDVSGGGGTNINYNTNTDLDVQGHPQIFSLQLIPGVRISSLDLVGVRAKDGTYRIFTRDQVPGFVEPLVQIQLDPATAIDGAIQVDPVIKDGMLYIASSSWKDPSNPTVDTSADILAQYAATVSTQPEFYTALHLQTKVRAIDLRKLVLYGIMQLAKGNKEPICVGELNPPRCVGQLPANIIKWQTTLPSAPYGSSGLTYDNGVIFVPIVLGEVYMLDSTNGSQLAPPIVPQPLPPAYGLPGAPVVGGVSVDNGKIFIPYGINFNGADLGVGGVAGYGIP